jgi:23S rRNA (adenine2503-C2)-methyltransferase
MKDSAAPRQVRPGDETPAVPLKIQAPKRGKAPTHFADLSPEDRRAHIEQMGEPKYRAQQLETHYFSRLTDNPDDWTDVPAAARENLQQQLFPNLLEPIKTLTADKGTTVKTLWRLFDGCKIESVLMRYPTRTTLCISSQVGCGMACPFCATGQMGLTRNLSSGEMLEQVRRAMVSLAAGEIPPGPTRLNNIVFMGMGEGLANYNALLKAIRTLIAPTPDGFGLSARHLTVSTVGLVPAIERFTNEGIPAKLALSLHAPDDDLRDELVPINSRYGVAKTLDAARNYFDVTGRRVSIEYALIKDMNDQAWRADLLAKKLNQRGRGWVHINPIPLNPTPGSIWTASDKDVENEFVARLRNAGIPTTIRDTRGSEIDGACGQLATQEPNI